MMPSSHRLLYWASKFMPKDRQEWFSAMAIEMDEIKNPKERKSFAYGCLKTAVSEWSHSRRGLHYIARGVGALGLMMLGVMGFYMATTFGEESKEVLFSKIISNLCLFYIFSAIILMMSLRGAKLLAVGGLIVAFLSACYLKLTHFSHSGLSAETFIALNVEFLAIVTLLFLATTYLGWLYMPEHEKA